MKFSGYASVTETPYDMGWYTETIARGAFAKTLSERPDVQLNLQHGAGGSGLPLARTGRNMTLAEDQRGLRVDADLDPDDPDCQLLARKMNSGLIDAMSFSFISRRETWGQDYQTRRITEADLHTGDVSAVWGPANPAASATMSARNLRAAVAGAGGRSTLSKRKELAEALGNAVLVEFRSVMLGGRTYNFRASEGTCNRCDGDGTISLQGIDVTCPQCGGSGDASGNSDPGQGDEDLAASAYTREVRAKYTQSAIDGMGKKGEAFGPDEDGHYSYPIADEEDLKNAIHAVGRGKANHDKIRKYIIGRAKALGLSSLIPDNWASDGSLKDAKSALSLLPNTGYEARKAAAEDRSYQTRVMLQKDRLRLERLRYPEWDK